MNSDRKAHITLEELLRLKKLEQPPAEFWNQFENELRAKQLAAIVEKRPWWGVSLRQFGVFSRYQVPLGAAAALAIALTGFHEYRIFVPGNAGKTVEDPVADVGPELNEAASTVPAPATDKGAVALRDAIAAAPAAPSEPQAVQVTAVEGGVGQDNSPYSHVIEAVSVRNEFSNRNWTGRTESLSGRSIALNLSVSRMTEPASIRNLFGLSQNLDAGLVPAHEPLAEPLAQMTSPAEEGRARFLGDALPVSATSVETPPLSNDRIVSRLPDDRRLYESFSRYGLGGDRLSIKF